MGRLVAHDGMGKVTAFHDCNIWFWVKSRSYLQKVVMTLPMSSILKALGCSLEYHGFDPLPFATFVNGTSECSGPVFP